MNGTLTSTLKEAGVLLQWGIVVAIDDRAVAVKVQLAQHDDLITDWLPVLQRKTQDDKFAVIPDLGEQVAVLLDSVGEDGVVLGAVYNSVDTVARASVDLLFYRAADGTELIYDRSAHLLTADVKGNINITATGTISAVATGPITLQSAASITLTAPTIALDAPTVTASGALTVQGLMQSFTEVMAKAVALFGHRHGNVVNGPDSTGQAQ